MGARQSRVENPAVNDDTPVVEVKLSDGLLARMKGQQDTSAEKGGAPLDEAVSSSVADPSADEVQRKQEDTGAARKQQKQKEHWSRVLLSEQGREDSQLSRMLDSVESATPQTTTERRQSCTGESQRVLECYQMNGDADKKEPQRSRQCATLIDLLEACTLKTVSAINSRADATLGEIEDRQHARKHAGRMADGKFTCTGED